jgi:large subunit ribosomal protein L21
MWAVIETGGKQSLVKKGDQLLVEKLEGEAGSSITFDSVLLFSKDETGKDLVIGNPQVKDAKVQAKILETAKGKKVTVFKYKPKKRYRVKKGHRQTHTKIEVTDILS